MCYDIYAIDQRNRISSNRYNVSSRLPLHCFFLFKSCYPNKSETFICKYALDYCCRNSSSLTESYWGETVCHMSIEGQMRWKLNHAIILQRTFKRRRSSPSCFNIFLMSKLLSTRVGIVKQIDNCLKSCLVTDGTICFFMLLIHWWFSLQLMPKRWFIVYFIS